ncbi:MAG: hypothetical protein ACW987_18775 [Candidatus Thorarchaeota archaeon]|jgi:hypothetical protein
MNLTIKELKSVIQEVLKNLEEEGQKGRDGYNCDDVQPRGFSHGGAMDFSKDSESLEGNRYKRQGSSNMGPWTNESLLRSVIRNMITESFKLKPMPNSKAKTSAPFNARASVGTKGSVGNIGMAEWKSTKKEGSVWENLAHWYNVPTVKESVHRAVEASLVRKMEAQRGQKIFSESISRKSTRRKTRKRRKKA